MQKGYCSLGFLVFKQSPYLASAHGVGDDNRFNMGRTAAFLDLAPDASASMAFIRCSL
jgi:hypothetical protein